MCDKYLAVFKRRKQLMLANPDFGIANFDKSGGKDYKSRNAKQFDIDELRLMAEAKPLSVLVFQCLTFVQDLECVKNNIVIK